MLNTFPMMMKIVREMESQCHKPLVIVNMLLVAQIVHIYKLFYLIEALSISLDCLNTSKDLRELCYLSKIFFLIQFQSLHEPRIL